MDDISRLRCDIFLINYSVGSFGTIRYYYITRGGVRILGGGGGHMIYRGNGGGTVVANRV